MSDVMAEPEDAVTEALGVSDTILPEEIRQHLGKLLAAAYRLEAKDHTEAASTERFADLLDKLNVAIGQASTRSDAEFQRQLLDTAEPLRRFAISLCRDRIAAEDLMQEAFMRAWKNRLSFQPGTNIEAWIFTILRNHFYSGQRKNGREVQDDDGAFAARMITQPEQSSRLDLQDVGAALDRLAAPMREALVLIALEHKNYEEAAAIMGCQVGTVKSRVWRARDQLTRMLGYDGTEIGTDALMLSADAR